MFDMNTFDPRVFQYERMTPQERATFLSQIKGRGEVGRFASNVRDYANHGWIAGPQQ